ncbi:MAG: gamma-butyrobetaine hydroxylase-like domain-containing protein [Burkholderiaceae bacterium]
MSGLSRTSPLPASLVLHGTSRMLEVSFSDGAQFKLPFEMLRVYSPSAEVRGHGPGQEVLQVGKRNVGIDTLEQVGNYAVQPQFSDGHNTGIYSWDYLYWLGENQQALWQKYLDDLAAAGASRDPALAAANIKISEAKRGGCG